MKKINLISVIALTISSNFLLVDLHAKNTKKYPNIDGKVLFQTQFDRVLSKNKKGVSPNNAFVYIEPNFSVNFNENWSVKSQWRIQPNDVLTTRNQSNPERYRTFLSNDRGMNFDEMGLLVEELKINFTNDDIKIFAGKFDPSFGNAHLKSKRMGVFTSQFNEDYNLREKIGAGVVAMLEDSQINFNTFFNDNTDLSRSAINDRGRASRNNNYAGDTGTISSYSIAMEGQDLFNVKNLFYNIGYRSLGVDNKVNRSRETGFVIGSEYLHKISNETSLIPFFEFVSLKNFGGIKGRDAQYTTVALIGNYRNWISSVSSLNRNIAKSSFNDRHTYDQHLQLSIGYKFTNNITVDVSRSQLRENGNRASMIGANVSYLYKF